MVVAPVLLFGFNRPDLIAKTIDALKLNKLATETELIVFSDGPRSDKDIIQIGRLREIVKCTKGFRSVTLIKQEVNKGLANSIIDGVSETIETHGKVIVLEDDLISSDNFLVFMNKALDYYQENKSVFSISGYTFSFSSKSKRDVYFTKRGSSWGWATWADRWKNVDWAVKDFDTFKSNIGEQKQFNRMGTDLSDMLSRQMAGKMNSWAIRWVYQQHKEDSFTVYPTKSKIRNLGFGETATHTFDYFNRYDTKLDLSHQQQFDFTKPHLDNTLTVQFVKMYSLPTRIRYKILNSILAPLVRKFK